MNKTWLVASHEYKRHVFTRRFAFGLLSVPFFILLITGLVFLIISMENNTSAVGYVDHSGLLADPLPAPPVEAPDKPIDILAYPDKESAEAALYANEIQGYLHCSRRLPYQWKIEIILPRTDQITCPGPIL